MTTCATVARQSRPKTEPSEWLKQHEALMHRVSKAAIVVGYGGTINGATAEQALENAEKALLEHALALQSQDAERLDWLLRHLPGDSIRYCVGVIADTADIDEFRVAIDQARRTEENK